MNRLPTTPFDPESTISHLISKLDEMGYSKDTIGRLNSVWRNFAAYWEMGSHEEFSLRHSKAMHLLQAGVNLVYIRDLLGHTDLRTTEIYARAETEAKRKALEAASPVKSDGKYPSWTENDQLLTWLQSFGRTDI